MKLDSCIEELERYLADRPGGTERPRVVFATHPSQVERLRMVYGYRSELQVKTPHDYALNGVPDRFAYQDAMSRLATGKHIVFGLCTWLGLYGKEYVKGEIDKIFRKSGGPGFRLIVICYGVRGLYERLSPRDLPFAMLLDAPEEPDRGAPQLCFIKHGLPVPEGKPCVNSLPEMPLYVETHADVGKLYVQTDADAKMFPEFLGIIQMVRNSYECLAAMGGTNGMPQDWGLDSQWELALRLRPQYREWADLFRAEIGYDSSNPAGLLSMWSALSEDKKWLYLLALKNSGTEYCPVLIEAARGAKSPDLLPAALYECILGQNCDDPGFPDYYKERSCLLGRLPEEARDSGSGSFVEKVGIKGKDAVKYLTSLTEGERHAVLKYCADYGCQYTFAELRDLLQTAWPDLSAYLSPIDFSTANNAEGAQYLARYFEEYRRCKLCNQVSQEMLQMVEEQAVVRRYNTWLPSSCQAARAVFNGQAEETAVIFVDAMGCEFAGYITNWARQKGVSASVYHGRAAIPTITECNKASILAVFQECGKIWETRELDDTKHDGSACSRNDQATAGYMMQEMEVLGKWLDKAYALLNDSRRVVLVADHGASRLAVIHGGSQEKLVACDASGTHGGRMVGGNADVSAFGDQVVKSDDGRYYSIAGYDFIKGGRRPSVETHGGATLEEVCVPVVVLTRRAQQYLAEVVNSPVKFNRVRMNETHLELYISPQVNAPVTVALDGQMQRYTATTKDGKHFNVPLPDLNKVGRHSVAVYAGQEPVAENLEFEAVSAAGGVKKLFP